jgi:hypothetical protein
MTRNGGDYNGIALASNATIADCEAQCCGDPLCVAFSYNNPQPEVAYSCVKGGVCCMVKSSVPPLTPNTYGPAVQTGYLPNKNSSLAPGPTPPFAQSTFILNATFDANVGFWNGSGDTWPTTWAADGTVYGWPCDANDSPMGLWSISGNPFDNDAPLQPAMVSQAPIDYTTLCAQYGKTGSYPYINVKPGSTIALNGSIYVTVSCMNYGDNNVFDRQHNLAGFLSRSDDMRTFTNITAVGAFAGKFAAPIIPSCGQNNDPCRALNDGWLYLFFFGAFNDEAYWCNNDAMFLARISEAQFESGNLSALEYFTGFSNTNSSQPQWVAADSSQAQPVFTFGRMLGENGITYHPQLGRYLMAQYGFIDDEGQPRPWHQEPRMNPHRTQLLLLESPYPWGPWSLLWRNDDSPAAPGLYTPTIPSAYLQPVQGDTAELLLIFSCLGGPSNCRYTLNWQKVTLALSPEAAAYAASH